jgi:DNA repair protein RadA/Sms
LPKVKKTFVCSSCGTHSSKWEGKCHSCGEWNTLTEQIITKETTEESKRKVWKEEIELKPKKLSEIHYGETPRILTQDKELNRVLGGGIVLGSLVLIGGHPGIGKSTLLLQLATSLNKKILYISGEESEEQIKMRAERINYKNPNCFVLTETNVVKILQQAKNGSVDLIIIDSIQTLSSPYVESTPGTITQIRECTGELQRFAKETNIPIFVIGHITKDGNIAGPKLLEHMVDVVLQFEGDRHHTYRILRTIKNRFGSTDEIGIYEMHSVGLRQVNNPSELLLSQSEEELSGSAICSTIEGLRPMLLEIQALVSTSVYGTPQRSATGFDNRRLSMLLAVLEKRCGLPFGQSDVFLNIAGGLKIMDPSVDLAIVVALISSLQNIPVNKKTCFAGEVGLSGEIRAVNRVEQRIQEANRLGFEQIYISAYNKKGISQSKYDIEILTVSKVEDIVSRLFE